MDRVFFILRGKNMKKVAIIVDGQFLMYRVKEALEERKFPEADTLNTIVRNFVDVDEEIYRIFFYHGEPSKQQPRHPITKNPVDFKETPLAKYTTELLNSLAMKELFALRLGETMFRGWKIRDGIMRKIESNAHKEDIKESDFVAEFQQKGVDIRIGLDVAWIASNHLVDRVLMVTGDTDFIPAMKFARREGIQVKLIKIGDKVIHDNLIIHSDFVKEISNQNIKSLIN